MFIDRIKLRDVAEGDLPTIFEHETDQEAIDMAAFTHEDPNDREAFDAHWSKLLASETIITRAILFDEELVGHLASWVQEGDREITYWVDRRYWGRGIATTAVGVFLDELDTRPLFARAAKDNIGSIRVLEKCGFEIVGEDRGFANARNAEIDELVLRLDR